MCPSKINCTFHVTLIPENPGQIIPNMRQATATMTGAYGYAILNVRAGSRASPG